MLNIFCQFIRRGWYLQNASDPCFCAPLTFLLWLNTEKSLLSWVAELRTGLVLSDMTAVTSDNITALDNILELTLPGLATLGDLNTFSLSTDEYVGAWYARTEQFTV